MSESALITKGWAVVGTYAFCPPTSATIWDTRKFADDVCADYNSRDDSMGKPYRVVEYTMTALLDMAPVKDAA